VVDSGALVQMDGASFLQTLQTASAGGFASPQSSVTAAKKPTQPQAWTLDNAGMPRDDISKVNIDERLIDSSSGTPTPYLIRFASQ
jgi:hypothetical protein